MTPSRKKIVKEIREEGRLAARSGCHIQTNPYPVISCNRMQWFEGFHVGEAELEAELEQQNAKNN